MQRLWRPIEVSTRSETVERSYFSYRYAVPGTLFSLLTSLINADIVIGIFLQHPYDLGIDVGALVATLTFLSSPSLGFVFAQCWHFLFNVFDIRHCFYGKTRKKLDEKRVTSDDSWRNGMWMAKIDYFVSTKAEDPELVAYLSRRWDLFHTFGSMILSLTMALILSLMLRISYIGSSSVIGITGYEHYLLCTISVISLIISLVLIAILIDAMKRVMNEDQNMLVEILDHYDPNAKTKTKTPSC